MELKNYMEDLVLEKLDDVMAQYPVCCTCDLCKRDIATLALNHLKPRYISSHKGDVFTRLDEMSAQYEVEVIQAIAQAIEVVHKNPRHAEEE